MQSRFFKQLAVAAVLIAAVGVVGATAAGRAVPVFGDYFVVSAGAPERQFGENYYAGPKIYRNVDISTDGDGRWVAVWHQAPHRERLTRRSAYLIDVARSEDNGATWSERLTIGSDSFGPKRDNLSPTVRSDGNGNWIMAWTSRGSLSGPLGRDADLLLAHSDDAGASWGEPYPLNTNAGFDWGEDTDVRLVNDNGGGRWLAVWSSTDSLGGRIGGDSDILYSRSTDRGVTWTTPLPLNDNASIDTGFDVSPDVTTDGSGRWLAVWSSGDGLADDEIGIDRDVLYAISDDDGETWSYPRPLNDYAAKDVGSDWNPRVATDRRGEWVAVWGSAEDVDGLAGTDRDVFFSRSSDNGDTWSKAKALNTNAANDPREDSSPVVVTDGAGNWLAIWHAWGGLTYVDGSDADIIVAYSRDGGRSWSEPEPINKEPSGDEGDDLFPGIATDASGHWVAIWQTFFSIPGNVSESEWRVVAAPGAIED